jgi:hypothetical protein
MASHLAAPFQVTKRVARRSALAQAILEMTMKNDPDKGYVAILGWSLNAVEAAEAFDRRYIVVAPDWAQEYCDKHNIPYLRGILSA